MSNQFDRVKKILGDLRFRMVASVPGCVRAIFVVAQELLGKTFEGIPALDMDSPDIIADMEIAQGRIPKDAMLLPDFEDRKVFITSAHTLVGPGAKFHKGLMGAIPFQDEIFGKLPANAIWDHNQKLKPVDGKAMSIKDVARFHAFMGPMIRKLDGVRFMGSLPDVTDRLINVMAGVKFRFDPKATAWFMQKAKDDLADLLDGFSPSENPTVQVRASTLGGKTLGWVSKEKIMTEWAPINDQIPAHMDVESALAFFDQVGWKKRILSWRHAIDKAKSERDFVLLHARMGLSSDSAGFEGMVMPNLLGTGLSKVALSALGRALGKDLALFRADGFGRFAVPLLLPPWLEDGTMPIMVPEGKGRIGQRVTAFREPNLHGGCLVPATIIGFTKDETIALPFQMKSNMDGDYDGDIAYVILTPFEHHLMSKLIKDAHLTWDRALDRTVSKAKPKKATPKEIEKLVSKLVEFWEDDGIGRREGALRRAAFIIQSWGGDPAKELPLELADNVTATIDFAKHTDGALGTLKAFKRRLEKIAGRSVDADIRVRYSVSPKALMTWRQEIRDNLMFKMRAARKDRTLQPLAYNFIPANGPRGFEITAWNKIDMADSWRPWSRNDLTAWVRKNGQSFKVWDESIVPSRTQDAKDIASHMGDYFWLVNLGELFAASRPVDKDVGASFLDFKVGIIADGLNIKDRGKGGFTAVWNAAIRLLKSGGFSTAVGEDVEKFFSDFARITSDKSKTSKEKEELKKVLLGTRRTVEFWLRVVIRNLIYQGQCGGFINNPRVFRDGVTMRIWALIDKAIGDHTFKPGPEELRALTPTDGYVSPPVDWMLDCEC